MSQSIEEFTRGAEHVEDGAHLAARLARGDRLRIKWGVDPTAPDIHLGHTIPMRALRRWQDAGHTPVIIIGDWTARIGDPTGRSVTRPPLSVAEVDANAETYLAQLFVILDKARTEVRFQSEWFEPMGLADVIKLTASRTVQQLLQRADFSERMTAERPISLHELLYPLLQGYDSVAVDADIEIGGTDQLFNLLAARDVQRYYGRTEPQDVVTFPLLEGLDGERKMSKSYDNYIGVAESPTEQYGKAMSIPDSLIVRYMTLVSDMPLEEVERYRELLASDGINPRDAKAALASAIVRQFHGDDAAEAAADEFRRVTRGGGLPDDVPSVGLGAGTSPYEAVDLIDDVLKRVGQSRSRSEIRRVIEQGGATLIDDAKAETWTIPSPGRAIWFRGDGWPALQVEETPDGQVARAGSGVVLKFGKRIFVRLVAR